MATFTWYIQGTSPTTVGATDIVQFAGATFDSAITVGAYNASTHVKASGGSNLSSGNTPRNNKFISQSGGTGSKSQADWGDGTEDIDAILTSECALKINFSHGSAVTTTGCIFYAYDGSTTTSAPTGVTFKAAEQGDTAWTAAAGSASGVTINDDTSATSHDYYILISASPDSVGLKSAFKLRMELTYS